ncbi:MAG: prepilin-type N-terminal cleavage/methylation domain-containing protein [Gemmatimonadaceae bacterium]|nr:prepilin-type N-terminal cleavage/methylation domain-containing protein [Gemmatimonadaceae bacterium]
MRGERNGFTLLEVLVALVLAAILVAALRGLAEGVGETALRISRAAHDRDTAANSERGLRRLVGSAELSGGDHDRFDGEPSRIRFTSWCQVPRGWQERCRVDLTFESAGSDSVALVGTVETGAQLRFHIGAAPGTIRYLGSARDGGRWFTAWRTAIAPPSAVAFIFGTDTLVVRIGDRG